MATFVSRPNIILSSSSSSSSRSSRTNELLGVMSDRKSPVDFTERDTEILWVERRLEQRDSPKCVNYTTTFNMITPCGSLRVYY